MDCVSCTGARCTRRSSFSHRACNQIRMHREAWTELTCTGPVNCWARAAGSSGRKESVDWSWLSCWQCRSQPTCLQCTDTNQILLQLRFQNCSFLNVGPKQQLVARQLPKQPPRQVPAWQELLKEMANWMVHELKRRTFKSVHTVNMHVLTIIHIWALPKNILTGWRGYVVT